MQLKPCDVIRPSIIPEENRPATAIIVAPPAVVVPQVPPAPTFNPVDTINTFRPFVDQSAWALCIMTGACYSPTPDLFNQAVRGVWGPTAQTTFRANNSTGNLGVGTVRMNGMNLVFLAGVQNEMDILGLVLSQLGAPAEYAGHTTLNYFATNATAVFSLLPAGFLEKDCIFVGHSAGGAVAALLAARNRADHRTVRNLTMMFGAPKPGAASLANVSPESQVQSYVARYDIVPLLPLRFGDQPFSALQSIDPVIRARNALVAFSSSFEETGREIVLGPRGIIEDDTSLWGQLEDLVVAAGAIFSGGLVRSFGDHAIATYAQRLRANFAGVVTINQWYNEALVRSAAAAIGAPF